ncbi:MAG: DUF4912 domain-containing protein [Treponema sp.]|nr:DUF4912 domain-containing protein [Treponema sp.]
MEKPHGHVSRPWLESLSSDELIKLADTYGIDIPPGLERIFIIEELLEASSMDEQEPAEEIGVNPSYSESALLPKQYNISFIDVIIRDPLWIFAFWEIKGHDREIHENAADFKSYFLKIIPLDETSETVKPEDGQKPGDNSFTVFVSADDSARYLGFAAPSHSEKCAPVCYIIKLGVIRGNSELNLAASAPFYMPRLYENDTVNEMSRNPLVRLSGMQDLSIIKSTDRQSRIKRQ